MILTPPPHIGTKANTIRSVEVWEGTVGEWVWIHHPGGSYVCGFNILNEKDPDLFTSHMVLKPSAERNTR